MTDEQRRYLRHAEAEAKGDWVSAEVIGFRYDGYRLDGYFYYINEDEPVSVKVEDLGKTVRERFNAVA